MSIRKGNKVIAGVYPLATESNNGLMSAQDKTKLDSLDPSQFATAEQGAKADTALQPDSISDMATKTWVAQQGYITSSDISGKEDKSNKVTSVSSSSTDTEYPTAKCLYTMLGNVEALILAL